MPLLPQFQSDDRIFQMLQNAWAALLNPMLSRPQLQSSILQNVSLSSSGTNVVNHLLGRKLQGWKVVRQRSSASIYDTQDSNPSPQLTLQLKASADVVVDIEVF